MILQNLSISKLKEENILIFLFLFSFVIRIPVIYFFGDTGLEYEWKSLVENLIEYKQLGWKDCEFAYSITKLCLDSGFILPNLWMPPFYAYYLYIFTFLNLAEQSYIFLILSSQILFASISVAVFYKINKLFFSKKISFYSSALFSCFPLYLYSCSQISSISIQVFLTILFFYFFFQLTKKRSLSSIILFSLSSGLLILLRGEFYAILILTLIYLMFLKINIKQILLIILITSLTVSPYLIRNVLIFEKIVMTKSFGYNLWKGNHPHAIKNSLVVGAEIVDEAFQKELDLVPRDKYLRINFEKIFLERAIQNIKKEPVENIKLFFRKIISFLLIDFNSPDPNYYNPIHYLSVLLLGITSLIGIGLSDKKSNELNYLILIFFAYVFIFSTVSILPRYKLIIFPMQIIFTSVLIKSLAKFFYQNK